MNKIMGKILTFLLSLFLAFLIFIFLKSNCERDKEVEKEIEVRVDTIYVEKVDTVEKWIPVVAKKIERKIIRETLFIDTSKFEFYYRDTILECELKDSLFHYRVLIPEVVKVMTIEKVKKVEKKFRLGLSVDMSLQRPAFMFGYKNLILEVGKDIRCNNKFVRVGICICW